MARKLTMSTAEAAEYIGLAEYTLRASRTNRSERYAFTTPPFVQERKGGQVLYLVSDLDAWIKANRHVREPRKRPRQDRGRPYSREPKGKVG